MSGLQCDFCGKLFDQGRAGKVMVWLGSSWLNKVFCSTSCAASYLMEVTFSEREGEPKIADVVDSLPRHKTERYKTRILKTIREIVVHHTATRPDVTVEQIAKYHVDHHGWPGIAYHFVIESDGTIKQTNWLETISYHAAAANLWSVGVCFVGDFSMYPPTDEQLESGACLLNWLIRKLGLNVRNVVGHKEVATNTTCPGDWKSWRHLLFRGE